MSTRGLLGHVVLRRSRTARVCGALLTSVFVVGTGGCPGAFVGLAYEESLVADYRIVAVDSLRDARIERTNGPHGGGEVVGPMVFAYGWNDDFIIAKQHPMRHWPDIDTNTTYWFIIEVGSGRVHGSLTEQQYTSLRQEIGVPSDLTFTKRLAVPKT